MNIFLCVANSARSQMAEGLAKSVQSRDTTSKVLAQFIRRIHPNAVVAMDEIGMILGSIFKSYR